MDSNDVACAATRICLGACHVSRDSFRDKVIPFLCHLVACEKITFAFVKSLFERDDYELRPGGLCVKEPVCCVYKRSSAAPILSRMYIGAGGLSYSGAVISGNAISDPFFFF